MIHRLRNIKPEKVFLIIALIYGLSFLMINPPFQAIDEQTHYFRASDISEGHMMPQRVNGESLVTITEGMASLTSKFPQDLSDYPNKKLRISDIVSGLSLPLNNNFKSSANIEIFAIVAYPPVPYLASALGMDLGKLFNLSPLFLLYIGRLMNLILWLLLIYLAIKVTPVHKWVLLLLSLMPMTIFQGASLSADSFTIAISFLVIAIFLKFALDASKKVVTKKDIFILFTLVLMLTLSKPFYFLLIFLFFLIPSHKFGNRKKMFLIFSLIFLSIAVIEALWYLTTHGLYVPENSNTSIRGQMSFILSNPAVFPHVMEHTLWKYSYLYLTESVGHLGWSIFLPQWLVYVYVVVLISVSLLDKNEIVISLKQKLVSLITLFAIVLMIFALEYIAWTPIGQSMVGGVQGRYFVPIAPLIFLLFYNKKIDYDVKNGLNVFIIIFILIILSFTLFKIITKFYVL
ncbi:DUF2142 domain-containing protein [Methanobacterium paludis]|uniref:DUF2142 domain-containing protein n=1 Tax=Methanobacterium paludis (strain DSM 25820 / JCM 18151 / SWAN1) TaxID=868131 RepID=F6D2I8_METPW|nr:DUF2142 domain-containing protein [Methanobacterium paludis]AEG17345.1 Protein of unknown function DUF2142, membrane [Methanobacterium paludis]